MNPEGLNTKEPAEPVTQGGVIIETGMLGFPKQAGFQTSLSTLKVVFYRFAHHSSSLS